MTIKDDRTATARSEQKTAGKSARSGHTASNREKDLMPRSPAIPARKRHAVSGIATYVL
ncbi:hypothetical protein HC766_09470 [Candidatus Gracilibacteria bacterium]|nr:hypothetical protein [Candidatus Gracilibacteria bacterium]